MTAQQLQLSGNFALDTTLNPIPCLSIASQAGSTLQFSVNDFSVDQYVGQGGWSDTVNRSICAVDFQLTKDGGDISLNTYMAEIWTIDGSTNLVALQATSNTLIGTNTWSSFPVHFVFATPYSYTANTAIAIVVTSTATSSANFCDSYVNSSETITGQACQWKSTLAPNHILNAGTVMTVYGQ